MPTIDMILQMFAGAGSAAYFGEAVANHLVGDICRLRNTELLRGRLGAEDDFGDLGEFVHLFTICH